MKFRKETMKTRRETKDLSYRKLGEKIGCSATYLSMIEKGQRVPKAFSTLYKLAKALDVPMEAFFEEGKNEKRNNYLVVCRSKNGTHSFQWHTSRRISHEMLEEARNWYENEVNKRVIITNIIKLEE